MAAITEFRVPRDFSYPRDIAAGPDGNLWFTEYNGDHIGRITTSGAMQVFSISANGGGPESIAADPEGIAPGPDGNLWFAELGGNRIGRITDDAVPAVTLQPDSGPPGTVVQVMGSGFGSFEVVKLGFLDSGKMMGLGTVTTDSAGRFHAQATIPSGATLGLHRVEARGMTSGLPGLERFDVTG